MSPGALVQAGCKGAAAGGSAWCFAQVIPKNASKEDRQEGKCRSPVAIKQYVDPEENREAFRLDSQLAWEASHANGLHVTADEADGWMAALERGTDFEAPECHARPGRLQRCSTCRVFKAYGG